MDKIEENSSKQIKYGAMISYIAIAINIILGIVYTPWLIHTIGDSDYGLYTIAASLISMFVMDFGLGTAITKFISQYRAEKNAKAASDVISISVQLYILLDLIIACVLIVIFFLIDSIYINFTPTELERFKVVYLIVAVFNIVSFPFIPTSGVLMAYERFVGLNICDVISKIGTVIITVIALLHGGGLYALVTVNAVVNLFVIIIKIVLIKMQTDVKISIFCRNKTILKSLLGFSVWITIMVITQRLVVNITPSMIGAMVGAGAATLFSIANTLEGYCFTVGNVLTNMFLPKISRVLQSDDVKKELTGLMIRVGRIQLIVAGLIIIGLFSVGRDFIICWMGEEYVISYYCALLMIVPNFFNWPLLIAATALTAINRVKEPAIVNVCTAAINIALEVFTIPQWGVLGAAIAICISYLFRAFAMIYLYRKYLQVDLAVFIKSTYIKLFIPLLFVGIIGVIIGKMISMTGWMGLIAEGSLVVLIFIVIIGIFGLTSDEKSQIKYWIAGKERKK